VIVLGIDPGLSGAIAALCQRRGFLDVADLPTCGNGLENGRVSRWLDVKGVAEILSDWSRRFEFAREAVQAVIERPIPMPSQQVWTAASNFDCLGVLRASVTLRGHPLMFVTPNEWKRYYRLGKDKSDATAVARNLYPDAPLSRVKDHNRAEAILIARHFLRTHI
jgi:hypothetical protein